MLIRFLPDPDVVFAGYGHGQVAALDHPMEGRGSRGEGKGDRVADSRGFVEPHEDFNHRAVLPDGVAVFAHAAFHPVHEFGGLRDADVGVLDGVDVLPSVFIEQPCASGRDDERTFRSLKPHRAVRRRGFRHIAFDHDAGPVFKGNDSRAEVFDRVVTLVPVGAAYRLPDHPRGRRIVHQETRDVDKVGAVVQQAARRAAVKEYGLPDGPTEHEFPALLARAAEAVVVPPRRRGFRVFPRRPG